MTNRRPKLIATDLDGTIVPHDEAISHRTIAAFTKARDLGVEIFFVTGRPPRWMGDVREAFDFGSAICCNGGLLYDLHNDKVLEQWMIQPTELQKAVDLLRVAIPNVSFAVESNDHFHREENHTDQEQENDRRHEITSTVRPNSAAPVTFTLVPASA